MLVVGNKDLARQGPQGGARYEGGDRVRPIEPPKPPQVQAPTPSPVVTPPDPVLVLAHRMHEIGAKVEAALKNGELSAHLHHQLVVELLAENRALLEALKARPEPKAPVHVPQQWVFTPERDREGYIKKIHAEQVK